MTPPILDHLVHLVQPDELEHAIAAFSELGFQVLRGGTHADGLTSVSTWSRCPALYL